LAKEPSQITIKEIIEALEGGLSLLECVKNPSICKRNTDCASRSVWLNLSEKISEALSAINLEDLVKKCREKEEKIINYNI
jgi:DNA-binding IscR family transcriptional regulator